jgi:hypothetical protein
VNSRILLATMVAAIGMVGTGGGLHADTEAEREERRRRAPPPLPQRFFPQYSQPAPREEKPRGPKREELRRMRQAARAQTKAD